MNTNDQKAKNDGNENDRPDEHETDVCKEHEKDTQAACKNKKQQIRDEIRAAVVDALDDVLIPAFVWAGAFNSMMSRRPDGEPVRGWVRSARQHADEVVECLEGSLPYPDTENFDNEEADE